MFALDHTIEAVQNAKKAAVNHFIRNEDLAKSFNALVEAETSFAKAAVKVSTDAATKFGDELTRQTKPWGLQVTAIGRRVVNLKRALHIG